jgi:transcriptional regulator with XRE-family HTH domain
MSPRKGKNGSGNKENNSRDKRKSKLKKEIGAKVKQIRKGVHYTQEQMVQHFDCGRANYSRIEKGEVFPNPTMMKALREDFKVSLHWLICEEGEMKEMDEGKKLLTIKPPADPQEAAEIEELLFHLDNVPLVKHAVLGFFLEYKGKNRALIEPVLQKLKEAKKAETKSEASN